MRVFERLMQIRVFKDNLHIIENFDFTYFGQKEKALS